MVLLNAAFALYVREHSWTLVFNYAISISRSIKSSGTLEFVNGNAITWVESDSLDEYDNKLCNWMSSLPQKLQQIPVWSLTLPGSHDAGSYSLESKSGISPDKPELRKWWMKAFGFVCYPVVKRWTITQTLNLTKQLEAGIRYFDFRAAPKLDDIDLYFVHGLYGARIKDMCQEINAFLDTNSKEIVIIHVQHFITASTEQQLHLLLELIRIFKNKVCPFEESNSNISLEQMWSSGYQVFIFFPCVSTVKSNYLWPGQYLPNPWANTTEVDNLTHFLTDKVNTRLTDRFYVTQGVLTPDDEYVKKHLFSSLYRRLVLPCNDTIDNWLSHRQAGPSGPNVVMTDFVEWNDFKIPKKVIGLNYKLL